MRIGDQIQKSGKKIIHQNGGSKRVNPTSIATRKQFSDNRSEGLHSYHSASREYIIGSRMTPDKSQYYLLKSETETSPKWKRRSKLLITHNSLVQKYELHRKSLKASKIQPPKSPPNVVPISDETDEEQVPKFMGKRKLCIGGKAPSLCSTEKKICNEASKSLSGMSTHGLKGHTVNQQQSSELFSRQNNLFLSHQTPKNTLLSNNSRKILIYSEKNINESQEILSDIENSSDFNCSDDEERNLSDRIIPVKNNPSTLFKSVKPVDSSKIAIINNQLFSNVGKNVLQPQSLIPSTTVRALVPERVHIQVQPPTLVPKRVPIQVQPPTLVQERVHIQVQPSPVPHALVPELVHIQVQPSPVPPALVPERVHIQVQPTPVQPALVPERVPIQVESPALGKQQAHTPVGVSVQEQKPVQAPTPGVLSRVHSSNTVFFKKSQLVQSLAADESDINSSDQIPIKQRKSHSDDARMILSTQNEKEKRGKQIQSANNLEREEIEVRRHDFGQYLWKKFAFNKFKTPPKQSGEGTSSLNAVDQENCMDNDRLLKNVKQQDEQIKDIYDSAQLFPYNTQIIQREEEEEKAEQINENSQKPLNVSYKKNEVENGHFNYGDKAKRITACRPKENEILMDVEWEERDDGKIPEKTTISSKIVKEFDHNLLIDFYESKIKFTYKNAEKKKLQTQASSLNSSLVKKEYQTPPKK